LLDGRLVGRQRFVTEPVEVGDPTRRAIFERLADRPHAVGELAGELPVSRPAVSQHLKVKSARKAASRTP
jgi:DNA-binding transcriptional ArsR family regulator